MDAFVLDRGQKLVIHLRDSTVTSGWPPHYGRLASCPATVLLPRFFEINFQRKTCCAGSGGFEGFNTSLAYYPQTQTMVVALSNVNGGAPVEIVSKLGALAHNESVTLASERKEISLPRDVLQKYVGTYELGPQKLLTQATGQAKVPAVAESPTRFFATARARSPISR